MKRVIYRRSVALALTGIALLLTACSASSASGSASTTTSSPKITTTTLHYVPQYVIVAGHRVLMPTEKDHAPISTTTGVGQNIVITGKGFAPYTLYAANVTPIVFTNLTSVTQVVRFHHFPNISKSPPIPPGRSWSFSYGALISLVYSNVSGSHLGQLYIGTCPPNCG